MSASDSIEIRPLRDIHEFQQAEEVQRRVWAMDEGGAVPYTILLAISRQGGVVMGAFEGEVMVGLCLGFLGRTPQGKIHHWSHINGVLAEKQGSGLGEQLKWAQRDMVLAMDLDLIRWTVDPMEGANATLNFGKLGVTCCTYERNAYGDMADSLNAGIASDRFIVDWEIDSERVKSRQAEGKPALSALAWQEAGAVPANPTEVVPDTEGIRRISETRLDLEAPQVLAEAPASYQNIKLHDLELAVEWRMQTRELFETYFSRGYVAREFASEMQGDERRNFFLLEHG